MKQNIEEPDYRSMNEVQLKYELIKIEKKILDIASDPIGCLTAVISCVIIRVREKHLVHAAAIYGTVEGVGTPGREKLCGRQNFVKFATL